jgi:hypothetical protein
MSTTVRKGRAWVPATVTTLLVVVLLFASGLVREILEDRRVAGLYDPDSVVAAFVYGPLAPTGTPGIVGDFPFRDSIERLGGGLVPVVILVFLFTWLAARAARAGSAFTVLLGAWLGTVLGVGLGALASVQVYVWQNDFTEDSFSGLQQYRVDRLGAGLYWGAIVGLFVGLVALLAWMVARPRAEEPPPVAPEADPPDLVALDPSSYPPPGVHARPVSPTSDDTVPAPDPPTRDSH